MRSGQQIKAEHSHRQPTQCPDRKSHHQGQDQRDYEVSKSYLAPISQNQRNAGDTGNDDDCTDIESIGGIVADKLVERGLVREPLDLFRLNVERLAELNLGTNDAPRVFGEKNATKAVAAIVNRPTGMVSAR